MSSAESCGACLCHQQDGSKDGEQCPGLVETKSVSSGTETYLVQVCPKAEMLGRPATFHELEHNGPGVIVLHRENVPTDEEYKAIARSHDL
jgi:hypothetical protein